MAAHPNPTQATKAAARASKSPRGPHGGFAEQPGTAFVAPLPEGGGFFTKVYKSTPSERIAMVKAGLPATKAKEILGGVDLPSERLYQALDISVSTLNRKAKNAQALAVGESERVLGLAKLIGQVQTMVEESGDPRGFDAGAWAARWLNEPLAALGGQRPVDFMDTMEGQGLVSDTLSRIQSGAYA